MLSCADPLDGLADLLDRLGREEPLDLPSPALGERIRRMVALRNRLDAMVAHSVAAFDRSRGFAACEADSAAAWLRREARLSPNAASEQVRVARHLADLPEVSRAFAAGELGLDHARVITRLIEDVPAETVREAEPSLVQAAQRSDPYRLNVLTRHLRHALSPQAALDEANRNHERRRLHLSETLDGLYHLDGVLDTEGGALLKTALHAILGPPGREDGRTPAQRRADGLVDLARRSLDSGELPEVGGQRPHLTLTADLATLAKLPGSPAADLDWGQPVTAELLRRIACDASVTCVLVDGDREPLSVGRASRTFTPAQRRAVVARDRGCVLCGRPAAQCVVHHLEHWADGGLTCVANGCLLCHGCHRRVHEGGYRVLRRPDRTWTAVRGPLPP